MFELLTRQPDDALLALSVMYKADPTPGKIDLGVGVYRDANGMTPVFKAVKLAEKRLLDDQNTKAYVGPEGDRNFIEAFWTLIGGPDRSASGVQTVGGTGALRLAAELLKRAGTARIYLGLPTWPNHAAIFEAAGLEIVTYPFFDVAKQEILVEPMMDALSGASAGDAVLLHACCHNPTGAVMTDALWHDVTRVISGKGLVPLVDSAYQGFGTGVVEDVRALGNLIDNVPEAIIAASASKSFGLYRERTGAVYVTAPSQQAREKAQSHLVNIGRASYSMPPDHGAAVVRTILENDQLADDWRKELEDARLRIVTMRAALAAGLSTRSNVLSAIASQQGMFSLLPLPEGEILKLRETYGVYMPLSGRINIAGLNTGSVERLLAVILNP